MQKVEGSSPFSRLSKSPAQAGFFDARTPVLGGLARHFSRLVPDSFRKPSAADFRFPSPEPSIGHCRDAVPRSVPDSVRERRPAWTRRCRSHGPRPASTRTSLRAARPIPCPCQALAGRRQACLRDPVDLPASRLPAPGVLDATARGTLFALVGYGATITVQGTGSDPDVGRPAPDATAPYQSLTQTFLSSRSTPSSPTSAARARGTPAALHVPNDTCLPTAGQPGRSRRRRPPARGSDAPGRRAVCSFAFGGGLSLRYCEAEATGGRQGAAASVQGRRVLQHMTRLDCSRRTAAPAGSLAIEVCRRLPSGERQRSRRPKRSTRPRRPRDAHGRGTPSRPRRGRRRSARRRSRRVSRRAALAAIRRSRCWRRCRRR